MKQQKVTEVTLREIMLLQGVAMYSTKNTKKVRGFPLFLYIFVFLLGILVLLDTIQKLQSEMKGTMGGCGVIV